MKKREYRVVVVPGWPEAAEAGIRTRYVRMKDYQAGAEYVRQHRRINEKYTYELESREIAPWTVIEVEEE